MPPGSFVAYLTVALIVAAAIIFDLPPSAKTSAFGAAGLSVFVALLALIQAELCDAESDAADRPVLDRATSYLKAKGKGDCYFTQQQYEVLFLKETPGGELDRPKTAAELLGNDDEQGDDDRPARCRRK